MFGFGIKIFNFFNQRSFVAFFTKAGDPFYTRTGNKIKLKR